MDSGLASRFAGQLARGELVLFTGAGFSLGAQAIAGPRIPSVPELRDALWSIAFPTEPLDDTSDLGDVLACAVKRSGGDAQRLLRNRLSVDGSTLPAWYRTWFSMPWYRVYTLNVDDLDEVANRSWDLPRPLRALSAISDVLGDPGEHLLSVHLNGRVGDYPNLTFSPQQYAERVARPDPWYATLVNELLGHPVVFVGTELNEPTLWFHMELRRRKSAGDRELRPGSYLISPRISTARRMLLQDLNIAWVESDAETFANDVLSHLHDETRAGHAVIQERRQRPGVVTVQAVSRLRTQPVHEPSEYLLGREPFWGDITTGFAVERTFECELADSAASSPAGLIVISGTGGAGKSTTLMRLCLVLQARGRGVGWVPSLLTLHPRDLRKAVAGSRYDVIAIDNVDRFGRETGDLLRELVTDNTKKLLLVAARGTRLESFGIEDAIGDVGGVLVTIPHLEDADIRLLLDALDRANRLGRLKGLTEAQREATFREGCGRQLLVAMIEATSGEKFEEKIHREYEELGPEQRFFYGAITVVTHLGSFVTRDEVLLASGLSTNQDLNRLQSLINQHLAFADGPRLRSRHSVVAEHLFDHLRAQAQLGDVIRGLAFAMATKIDVRRRGSSRETRLVARLISHDWLLNTIGRHASRLVYAEVEDQLSWDPHYWLQRGSAEVEEGDLRLAENYLSQARSLAPNDQKITTEWAYLILKRSALSPDPKSRAAEVEAAFDDLEEAIEIFGSRDRYPYHVMGAQGLRWVNRATLSRDQRAAVLLRLRNVVNDGARLHPHARELKQLADDLQREYLLTATEGA